MPSHPVRTCVGCRRRAAKQDLVRVVAQGDGEGRRLVPDLERRLPGRGAYLHPEIACLDQAVRRRAFPRALRVPAPLGDADLRECLRRVAQGDPAAQNDISTTDRQRWSSSS